MKKTLACLAVAAMLTAAQPTPAAQAAPVINPTFTQSAHLSYTGMIDSCVEAELYLTTIETVIATPDGPVTASDHGEGSLTIRDTCNLTPPECDEDCDDLEPRPTVLLSVGLQPTRGPAVVDPVTLTSATYRETLRTTVRGAKRVKARIDWKGRGQAERSFEHEQSDEGLFLRAGVTRKAKATFTIVAGRYTVAGTTTRAQIAQAAYTML